MASATNSTDFDRSAQTVRSSWFKRFLLGLDRALASSAAGARGF
jgi:hypothetical protein